MDPIDTLDDLFDAVDWNVLGVWVGSLAALAAAIGTVGTLIWTIRTANEARRDTIALRQELALAGCVWGRRPA